MKILEFIVKKIKNQISNQSNYYNCKINLKKK